MAKEDVWMPFYIGDYLADTQLLTTEQHGAYVLLIMAYWKNKGLPNNQEVLMGITKLPAEKWEIHQHEVLKYFEINNGRLIHHRIDRELELLEKRQNRGRKAANKRWGKCEAPSEDRPLC